MASISLADRIVLGGSAGAEMAAKADGHDITVPFNPGRTDATQDMSEVDMHAYLEPRHDAFRNYMQPQVAAIPAEHLMVDRAFMFNLGVPQMATLLGCMRGMSINVGDSNEGILTDRPGQLTNDFFANLIDMGTVWEPGRREQGPRNGRAEVDCHPSRPHLWLQLAATRHRGGYAANGGEKRMIDRFVKGWVKVMENDRFDLHR